MYMSTSGTGICKQLKGELVKSFVFVCVKVIRERRLFTITPYIKVEINGKK